MSAEGEAVIARLDAFLVRYAYDHETREVYLGVLDLLLLIQRYGDDNDLDDRITFLLDHTQHRAFTAMGMLYILERLIEQPTIVHLALVRAHEELAKRLA